MDASGEGFGCNAACRRSCTAFDALVILIVSFLAAISNEMKRVQLKIQEEKEKEKKIYAKMFA